MPRWVRAAGSAVLTALAAHGRAVAFCAVPSGWDALTPSERALFRQLDDIVAAVLDVPAARETEAA